MAFGKKKNKNVDEDLSSTSENTSSTSADTSTNNVLNDLSNMQYSTPRPEPGTKEEKKWIKEERKKLRAKLKESGIKSRTDFENIAKDLNLVLDKGRKARWLLRLRYFGRYLRTNIGLGSILLGAAALLSLLFLVSVLSDKAGSFTINLTADMLKSGFILSETADFDREEARLFSEEIEDVNNISISEIPSDIDIEQDGSHNGDGYVAYTFYIKNNGEESGSYAYYLDLEESTMGLENACWAMLFEDGKQIVYANTSADGNAEELFGYRHAPMADSSYDYAKQYYSEGNKFGIKTTPFADEKTVAQGIVENVKVGDVHKYTVVLWIEGDDPECTNDLFGGYARFAMNFEKVKDEDNTSIFNGVYRTEYDDYIKNYFKKDDKESETTEPKKTNGITVEKNKK